MDFEVDEPIPEIENTDSFHDSREILMNYDKLKKLRNQNHYVKI